MSATMDGPRVNFEVTTQERVNRWLARELQALGITWEQLDEQARAGRFQSDRARLVWMATPPASN